MSRLNVIEGIGPAYEKKLKESGIRSVSALLLACATRKSRAELSYKSDVSEKLLLKWANFADLMRVRGVGTDYAEILEYCGVETINDLTSAKSDILCDKIRQANSTKSFVRKLPTQTQLENWIRQAKNLPRIINY